MNYSPSKTNLTFYGVAEKVENIMGLVAENLWYSLNLVAQDGEWGIDKSCGSST